jgi:NAD(P)-dependent dehydrogenase (short-subunit alcohol dehydrogenase family)
MALKDFSGITAVVTGSASGIGRATAQALYAEGANVVLADLNSQGLQETEALLKQHSPDAPGQIIRVPTDVTQEQDVQALMTTADNALGRIDLVVTCAGIGRNGPIDTFAASDMRQLIDINFMGTFHSVQKALPAMRRQGSGYFVCLSSVAGKLSTPFLTGYCASKWAVRGFTSAVRAELEGSGIGITTVFPAWVDTPMVRTEGHANINVLLKPEQVATAILQAVQNEQRDLTLAPNPEISQALKLYAEDPEKAERRMGRAAQHAAQQ